MNDLLEAFGITKEDLKEEEKTANKKFKERRGCCLTGSRLEA